MALLLGHRTISSMMSRSFRSQRIDNPGESPLDHRDMLRHHRSSVHPVTVAMTSSLTASNGGRVVPPVWSSGFFPPDERRAIRTTSTAGLRLSYPVEHPPTQGSRSATSQIDNNLTDPPFVFAHLMTRNRR
ncbi:MAG: hypothetical protein M3Q65_00225 [Chloroflexota bacterium]|nr:hypothetical protein [Chloroflexota bacterium]